MYNVYIWYKQLSQQVFVVDRETQKQRLGGLSVEKIGAKKAAAQKERLLRGAETRRRRKTDRE